MVVVEVAADLGVPLLRQRLVLVEAGAVGELRRGEVEDPLPRAVGDQVDEAEHVLIRVAEAHAAADPGLVEARRAREVERRHALVLVPGAEHPLRVRVGALGLEPRKQVVPQGAYRRERRIDRARLAVPCEQRTSPRLVHDAGPVVLRRVTLLDVAEDERERLLLARSEPQVELVRPDRVPAVRDAAMGRARERHRRLVQAVVHADEGIARRVEAVDLARAAEEHVVISALAVLRRVVDRRALDLDLADRVRALVVREVVQRLVEAELDVGEERQLLRRAPDVADRRLPDLRVLAGWDEEEQLDLDAVLRAEDPAVAEPVPALVPIERRLRRLPARIPDGVAVPHVEVAPDRVVRNIVVAVAREPPKPCVAPERVAATRVRAEAEEVVLAEVVQPGEGCVRPRDDVFVCCVVEVPVWVCHRSSLVVSTDLLPVRLQSASVGGR